MSTIRSQIVDAIVATLNEPSGRPTGLSPVVRCQLSKPRVAPGVSWIFVRSGEDEVRPVGTGTRGTMREHAFTVIVDCIAPGDNATPADKAVDPLIAWCVKQLDEATLGGLAFDLREMGTAYTYRQGDYPLCRARISFVVRHTTKSGNAELKT